MKESNAGLIKAVLSLKPPKQIIAYYMGMRGSFRTFQFQKDDTTERTRLSPPSGKHWIVLQGSWIHDGANAESITINRKEDNSIKFWLGLLTSVYSAQGYPFYLYDLGASLTNLATVPPMIVDDNEYIVANLSVGNLTDVFVKVFEF